MFVKVPTGDHLLFLGPNWAIEYLDSPERGHDTIFERVMGTLGILDKIHICSSKLLAWLTRGPRACWSSVRSFSARVSCSHCSFPVDAFPNF